MLNAPGWCWSCSEAIRGRGVACTAGLEGGEGGEERLVTVLHEQHSSPSGKVLVLSYMLCAQWKGGAGHSTTHMCKLQYRLGMLPAEHSSLRRYALSLAAEWVESTWQCRRQEGPGRHLWGLVKEEL